MPFEALREQLLKGGIAPRRVRRYLAELDDHLAALTEREIAAGYEAQDAATRARALLGPDAELAQAWLTNPRLKSLTARAPWLVFGVLPPLELLVGVILLVMVLVMIGLAGGVMAPHHRGINAPQWFQQVCAAGAFLANFAVGPVLALLLARTAQRQRLNLAWPLLAMAIIAAFGLHMTTTFRPNSIQLGLTSVLPFMPRALGGPASLHWPLFLTQCLLIMLPGAWLVLARRRHTAPV